MGCPNCAAAKFQREPQEIGVVYSFIECDLLNMDARRLHLIRRAQSVARRIWNDDEVMYLEIAKASPVERELAAVLSDNIVNF